ncbi:MAG: PilZ domain-containing protein [Clostridiales bacterium]|mgnify:CR=1 FL=1|nr:PilZ domain-containing protein [Clostridiales bacterium]
MDVEKLRKCRRMELNSKLVVKRIDSNEQELITINVFDLSKSGVGFYCEEKLEMDSVYESHIMIWTKERIHVLLRIVRIEQLENGYEYGSIFMGLSETDAFRIEVWDTMEQACK